MKLLRVAMILLFIAFSALASSEVFALDKVSLQLNWKYQFEFAGFVMAKEKGYYEEAGLQVDIREFVPGVSADQLVSDGHAEYGISNAGALIAFSKAFEKFSQEKNVSTIHALAAIMQHQMYVIAVPGNSPLKTANDLRGKRIVMDVNELNGTLLAALSKIGIGPNDFIAVTNDADVVSMFRDDVDAFAVFLSNEPFLANSMGYPMRVILNPVDEGLDFYEDVLIASTHEIRHHPERVNRFIAASVKGWEYALSHVEETIQILTSKYNSQMKGHEALLFEARALIPVVRSDVA